MILMGSGHSVSVLYEIVSIKIAKDSQNAESE